MFLLLLNATGSMIILCVVIHGTNVEYPLFLVTEGWYCMYV